jgi:hypothetical protein
MKRYFIHGIVAGILSTIAGIVYLTVYQKAMFLDFSSVINSGSIAGVSLFACLLMAFGYWLIERQKNPNLKGWLNIGILLISFLSILGPLGMSLPLDIDFPEMFPGLAIPLHFIPAMIFFGLDPFFKKKQGDLQSNI